MENIGCSHEHDDTKAHEQMIEEWKVLLQDEEKLNDLATIFKALSDTTRLKIIFMLSRGEMCVCDIAEGIGMSQSAVSHQLSGLRTLKLVRTRREGRSVIYALDDDHVLKLFEQGWSHVKHL